MSDYNFNQSWKGKLLIYLLEKQEKKVSVQEIISIISLEELEMIEQDDLLVKLKIGATSWNAMYKSDKKSMPFRYKYTEGDRVKYRYNILELHEWLAAKREK